MRVANSPTQFIHAHTVNCRSVHVGHVLNVMALWQCFFITYTLPVSINPPVLHNYTSFTYRNVRAPYTIKQVCATVCCPTVCSKQETVSIHGTTSLRKLYSLGKCHKENMSKSCLFGNYSCLCNEGRDRIPEEEKEYLDKRLVKKKKRIRAR
jgi:hypothetical protein